MCRFMSGVAKVYLWVGKVSSLWETVYAVIYPMNKGVWGLFFELSPFSVPSETIIYNLYQDPLLVLIEYFLNVINQVNI